MNILLIESKSSRNKQLPTLQVNIRLTPPPNFMQQFGGKTFNMSCFHPIRTCFFVTWTRLDATDGIVFASFLGEVAVPSHISPQAVFNYLVKNASFYDFQTLPLESGPFEKTQHLLFGTDRVLTQERYSDTRTYDILRDNYEYDITFVVSPKESSEEGIVNTEYIVLMTSRRELFPKLMLDLHLRKKSPSSSSLSTMNGNRKASLPDNGEVEPERGQ